MAPIITITNTENSYSWTTHPTGEEFQKFEGLTSGRKTISIPCSLLFPVRTNSPLNFAKDFFLPTVVNQVLRIESVAWRILALFGALLIDALTFPVRLVTCIPRVIRNANTKEHPLKSYLIAEGIDKKILKSDHVSVKASQFFYKPSVAMADENGNMLKMRQRVNFVVETQVNFIEMPRYPHCDHFFKGHSNKKIVDNR